MSFTHCLIQVARAKRNLRTPLSFSSESARKADSKAGCGSQMGSRAPRHCARRASRRGFGHAESWASEVAANVGGDPNGLRLTT